MGRGVEIVPTTYFSRARWYCVFKKGLSSVGGFNARAASPRRARVDGSAGARAFPLVKPPRHSGVGVARAPKKE